MKRIIKCIENEAVSIQAAVDSYIISKTSEGIAEATLSGYKRTLKLFVAYCNKHNIDDITQISKKMMEEYKLHLIKKKTPKGEPMTLEAKNSYLRIVRCFINHLIEDEQIPYFKMPLFPSKAKDEVSVYTDEELKLLLSDKRAKAKDFGDKRDYVMVATFLLTGIRRSTLQAMQIADIDFTNDTLSLRHLKRDNAFTVKQIPLNTELKPILQKYLKDTNLEKFTKYLFPNVEGNCMEVDSINHRLERYFKNCGVSFRGCHEFRRTFATKAYKTLRDLSAVQKLMLLSDPRMLLRYINADFDIMLENANKLNFIGQIKEPRVLKGNIKKGGLSYG